MLNSSTSNEYRQHSNQQLLQIGKYLSPAIIIGLSYFSYSDIFFRKMPICVFVRILPIFLFITFSVLLLTNLATKKPILLIRVYHSALFSLVCMSYLISILVWDTSTLQASITGLVLVCVAVYVGVCGPIIYISIIYFIPSLLFIIYVIYFKNEIEILVDYANSFAGMLGLLFIYNHNEGLRKKVFFINNKLELQSLTDPLTKMNNRRAMWNYLNAEVIRQKRNNKSFSIIMIDLDRFKLFNDLHGHECGDFILGSVAKTIISNLRNQDIGSRWGGEEFLILLPETDIGGAKVLAEKIRVSILQGVLYNKYKLLVTATLGLSEFNGSEDIEYVIKMADDALYKGKNSGRNCVASMS